MTTEVEKTLAEHRIYTKWVWGGPDSDDDEPRSACTGCEWVGDTNDGDGFRIHLAAVLASLPDDRLAEAEAKVQRVEKHMAFRERLGSDSSPHYEIRAALSGGDATADRNFAHCTQHAAHDVDCSWCRTAEQDLARALGEETSR